MNANHEKVAALFDAALKLTPAERPAFLAAACGNDAELRRQLEDLLKADAELGDFLPEAPQRAATIKLEFPAAEDEALGTRISHYKLLQKIGEGGCGTVYMAEQEEPVRRRVALKVIKLGMDTKSVVARFEAERQALAMMDHPNIAKVLDAGTTDKGRPYFVMELVRGIRITEYCDQNQLSTEARLELFISVCHAVQHAHQKGIIHRDLKPSNILVTLHDGVPVPKVIDFGIAKAIEQKLTDKTLFTELHQFIGTPAYMSPEQAEMSGLDIDTRSDIYSLGVLLYELLTGQTPFDAKELLSQGLDAMRKTIREKEPLRPSTRLTQALVAADVRRLKSPSSDTPSSEEEVRAFSRRLLRIKEQIALVRGDLDWIVMKCLEKDRTRRFETANGLAADLKRHLNNEPVVARPPSTVYRFKKMVQRNRTAALAAAAVLLTLVVALALSTAAFLRERSARLEAAAAKRSSEAESIRANSVTRFMDGFFDDIIPELLARGNRTATRRLLEVSERLALELTNAPFAKAQLHFEIASAYADLLWEYKASFPQFRAAERLASETGASGSWLAEAAHVHRLATEMWDGVDTNAAAKLVEAGKAALGRNPPAAAVAAWALAAAAEFTMQYGTPEQSEQLAREALRLQPGAAPHPGFQIDAAYPLSTLLQVTTKQGNLRGAEVAADNLLALLQPELANPKSPAARHNAGVLGPVWQSGWDTLPESSLKKALAAAAPDGEYTRSVLQGLLGVAVARGGNWQAGLDLIQSGITATDLNRELWESEIKLGALIGRTELCRSLAFTGLAQFASDADAVTAKRLAEPILATPLDPALLPILTNLVARSLEGNVDTVIFAKLTLALLRYRLGEATQAAKALDEFFAAGSSVIGDYYFDVMKPGAWFLRSAIEVKLGNHSAAEDAYRQGLRLHSPALRAPGTPYRGLHWSLACTAELLRREALSLLGSEPNANP